MKYDKRRTIVCVLFAGYIAAAIAISGCQSVVDMDKPIPPRRLMWEKKGAPTQQVASELNNCGIDSDRMMSNASLMEKYEAEDICMLKKGFKFVPRPNGWRDTCLLEAFRDSVACKWSRGEYHVEPD